MNQSVDFLESVFIEIETKLHKSIVVGSLYRVPNSSECLFSKKCKELLQGIQSETNKELIISIDPKFGSIENSHTSPNPAIS